MIRRRFNSNKHKVFNYVNYMTVEAIDDTVTVSLPRPSMYGIDGIGWRHYSSTIELRKGQMLSVKDNVDSEYYGKIVIKGICNLRGNCMSLVYGDNVNEVTMLKKSPFHYLFASNKGIQSVDKAFLPATTLVDGCYQGMFYECTSLVNAPELPATTLAEHCYSYMFSGCIGLMQAPKLPATTLADYCYRSMFYGCTKLNYIKMLATDISADSCLRDWVEGVASTGTFVKSKDATWDVVGDSGVPTGWTIEYE